MAFGSQEGKQADIHRSVFTHYKRNVYSTRLINPELCICLLSKLQSHKNQKDPLKKNLPLDVHSLLQNISTLTCENYWFLRMVIYLNTKHAIKAQISSNNTASLFIAQCHLTQNFGGKIKNSSVKSLTYLKISPVNARSQQQKPLSFTFRQITKEKTTSVGNTCYDVYSAEKTQVFQEGAA